MSKQNYDYIPLSRFNVRKRYFEDNSSEDNSYEDTNKYAKTSEAEFFIRTILQSNQKTSQLEQELKEKALKEQIIQERLFQEQIIKERLIQKERERLLLEIKETLRKEREELSKLFSSERDRLLHRHHSERQLEKYPQKDSLDIRCKYKGNCNKKCKYLHTELENRIRDIKREFGIAAKSLMCRNHKNKICNKSRNTCLYAHDKDDLCCSYCGRIGHYCTECAEYKNRMS